jgi:hypothetical protein
MEAPSLAILCIHIADETTSFWGSNAILAFHHLFPYYHGSSNEILVRDLPYSLSSEAEIAEYHALVSTTLAEIAGCVSALLLCSYLMHFSGVLPLPFF